VTSGLQILTVTANLALNASDDTSGVSQMLISNRGDFSGAIWESYRTSRSWAVGNNSYVYVRFRDSAGNMSPTNYAAVPKERALNGGFNTYLGTSNIPISWKATNFTLTDGKNTSIKKEGTASVKIIGAAGNIKILSQILTLAGNTGDKFTFSFCVKGAAIPVAGNCQVQVLFYTGTVLKTTRTVNCQTGTYSFQKKTLIFTTTSAYTKVVIQLVYMKGTGAAWFDAVSLIK
jgi:hypothetical protein